MSTKRTHPYIPARNQRLPAEFYETVGQVCFITLRAYRGQSPFFDPPFNDAVVEALRTGRDRWGCLIHVYCLMPDHLQMLVSPRETGHSVLTFVNLFKGNTTNLSWDFGWQGKLWQPRSYDHVVRREKALTEIAEYIRSDPIRSGLVDRVEQYLWYGFWDPFPE